MNASIPTIRLSLFALTSAAILTAAAVYSGADKSAQTTASTSIASQTAPLVTLPTISVRPSAEEIAAAISYDASAMTVLPTIFVRPSEEEVIAALIDPTDTIAILPMISVYPDADELATAAPTMVMTAATDREEESSGALGAVLSDALNRHHRLRLDMPYYSFGKVLTNARKD